MNGYRMGSKRLEPDDIRLHRRHGYRLQIQCANCGRSIGYDPDTLITLCHCVAGPGQFHNLNNGSDARNVATAMCDVVISWQVDDCSRAGPAVPSHKPTKGISKKITPQPLKSLNKLRDLAERQGFEPWIRSPVCRISSAVHSTTLPPLREVSFGCQLRHCPVEEARG